MGGGGAYLNFCFLGVFGCSFLGGYLSFCFFGVLGVVFFLNKHLMALSLCPLSMRNIPYPHCSSLYTLGDLSKHVKSAHLPTNLVS